MALNRELVTLVVHYDAPGDASADGEIQVAANDSASGVAAMLEIARLWKEQDYTPRRTVLFVALTGTDLTYSGAQAFTESYAGPAATLVDVAGFSVARLGAGGDILELSDTPQRVADLVEGNARTLGATVERGNPLPFSYQEILRRSLPMIVIQRGDSEIAPADDTADRLDTELLQEAGELINLSLITVSRDANW